MTQLAILSGKGGTGKTTIAGALAHSWRGRALFVDADVDASNLHLLTEPETILRGPFIGGKLAAVDPSACTQCGACTDLCRFGAIRDGVVSRLACEGCGLCSLACPQGAIEMAERTSGEWFASHTRYGFLLHAELHPGEGNSGKLVGFLKERAGEIAHKEGISRVVCDGPPGTGCPAMATLAGAHAVLVVTEPSTSGLHDLRRVLDLARHFRLPAAIVVNRADVAPSFTRQVTAVARDRDTPVIAEIPYDPAVPAAAEAGFPVPGHKGSPAAVAVQALATDLEQFMESV